MARVHFLNVLEGDCSIIEHDNGKVTMIDICCGNLTTEEIQKSFTAESLNAGIKGNFNQKVHPTNPITYLNHLGIDYIFRYIQTHPDMDHMDGLNELNENYSIYNFGDTKNTKPSPFDTQGKYGRYKKEDWDCYQQLRSSKKNPKALFYYDGNVNKYYAYDDNGKLQDDYLQILSPTKELLKAANENEDWNDSSYVILYCIQGFKILFCGDADADTLFHLVTNHSAEIKGIDVLIAPHHGRKSEKDFKFLDVMKPKITLMGNAKSQYLAYDEWNRRELVHFTNNQTGNVLIEVENRTIHMSISDKAYADKYVQTNKGQAAKEHDDLPDYWRLF